VPVNVADLWPAWGPSKYQQSIVEIITKTWDPLPNGICMARSCRVESLTRDSLMTLTVHIVFRIFCGFVLGSLGHYSQLSMSYRVG